METLEQQLSLFPSLAEADCWGPSGYTHGLCCSDIFGHSGAPECWAPPEFTFERCCHIAAPGASDELPKDVDKKALLALAPPTWPTVKASLPEVQTWLWEFGYDYLHFHMEKRNVREVKLCTPIIFGTDIRQCETYTLGDGVCILEVAGPRDEAALVRSSCNPPLFLCPLAAPVALLLLPKAASTALSNWAGRLDRLLGRWSAVHAAATRGGDAEVTRVLKARFAKNSSRKIAKQLAARARGARSDDILPQERRRTAVFTDLREVTGAVDVILPAMDCPTCCHPASWRTRVVVARHPLARLVSYFGMAWVGNARHGNFSSWTRLTTWLMHVTAVEPCPRIADVWFPEDEYHTQPLIHWLENSRGPYGVKSLGIPSGIVGLRIERLNRDVHKLQGVLCARHGFCGRLPPVPRRRLEGARIRRSDIGNAGGGFSGSPPDVFGAPEKASPTVQRQAAPRRSAGPPPLRDLWADEKLRAAIVKVYTLA